MAPATSMSSCEAAKRSFNNSSVRRGLSATNHDDTDDDDDESLKMMKTMMITGTVELRVMMMIQH
eukprot:12415095-Karenia_brevis.AAC.1